MPQSIGVVKAVLVTALCVLFANFGAGAAARFGAPPDVAKMLLPSLLLLMGAALLFATGSRVVPKSAPTASAIAKSCAVGCATAALNISVILGAHSGSPIEATARPELSYVFTAGLLGPLAEELVFVGFLFLTLRARLKLPPAIVIVAIFFSIAHSPTNALSFEARLLYMINSCLLFEYAKNIVLNVVAHMLANGLTVLSYSEISGLEASLRDFSRELAFLPLFFLAVLVTLAWTTFDRLRRCDRSAEIFGAEGPMRASSPSDSRPPA